MSKPYGLGPNLPEQEDPEGYRKEVTELWVDYAMELDRLMEQMNEHELYSLLFVARRLEMGRKKYGPLSPDKKPDWLVEAAEEAADMLVYLSMNECSRPPLT